MFALGSRATLTREINETFEFVKESDRTARKKKSWCENLERNIKQNYPTSRLILVGSSTTGFATEGCDVDLTLVRPDRTVFYESSSSVQVLRRIRDGLRTLRCINTEVIRRLGNLSKVYRSFNLLTVYFDILNYEHFLHFKLIIILFSSVIIG